jgi:hypothetical protein
MGTEGQYLGTPSKIHEKPTSVPVLYTRSVGICATDEYLWECAGYSLPSLLWEGGYLLVM